MEPGSFVVELDEAARRLSVAGEVDDSSAPLFDDALRRATDDYRRTVTVELSDVTFLPSAAVSLIVTSMRELTARGERLVLVAADGTIAQRVLRVCGLDHRTS